MVGGGARRRGPCRLPVAGGRAAQAPATRTRRAGVGPALVIAPWRRGAPEAAAEGGTPTPGLRALGVANRGRAPRAVRRVTATVPGAACPPGTNARQARARAVRARAVGGVR